MKPDQLLPLVHDAVVGQKRYEAIFDNLDPQARELSLRFANLIDGLEQLSQDLPLIQDDEEDDVEE